MLGRPELRQIRQRIVLMVRLLPFSIQECKEYILHRLRLSCAGHCNAFTPEALDLLAKGSLGIPRVVNILCENVMIAAYAAQVRPVTREIVAETLKEFMEVRSQDDAPFLEEVVPVRKARRRWMMGAAAGFGIVFLFSLGWMLGQLMPISGNSELHPATFHRVFQFFGAPSAPSETVPTGRSGILPELAPQPDPMQPQPVVLPLQPSLPSPPPLPSRVGQEPSAGDAQGVQNAEGNQEELFSPLPETQPSAEPGPDDDPEGGSALDLATPSAPDQFTARAEADSQVLTSVDNAVAAAQTGIERQSETDSAAGFTETDVSVLESAPVSPLPPPTILATPVPEVTVGADNAPKTASIPEAGLQRSPNSKTERASRPTKTEGNRPADMSRAPDVSSAANNSHKPVSIQFQEPKSPPRPSSPLASEAPKAMTSSSEATAPLAPSPAPAQPAASPPARQDDALAVWGGKVEKAAVAPLVPAAEQSVATTAPSTDADPSQDTTKKTVVPQDERFPGFLGKGGGN